MTLVDGLPSAHVPTSDRGLAYGDGLFETLAVRGGRVLALGRHLDRLTRDAARLGLALPARHLFEADVAQVTAAAPDAAVIKIVVTRGDGGRGYRPPPTVPARRIVSLHAWPELPVDAAPLTVFLCRHPLSGNPITAGIKHLNRLDQVLASAEWPDAACFEGLMSDAAGRLVEGTRTNLFLVHGRRLITPQLATAGVAGIVREALLEHAPAVGCVVEERAVTVAEVTRADELFLTNSIVGVRSVRTVLLPTPHHFVHQEIAAALRQRLRDGDIIP